MSVEQGAPELWTPLVAAAEIPPGRGVVVERPEKTLAVFLIDGQPHVLDNLCPHRDGDLGAGYVKDGCVFCPLHAWPFDLRTGECVNRRGVTVRVYPSRIQGGMVEAKLENGPSAP